MEVAMHYGMITLLVSIVSVGMLAGCSTNSGVKTDAPGESQHQIGYYASETVQPESSHTEGRHTDAPEQYTK
jgi:uncharacterized lipoprotein